MTIQKKSNQLRETKKRSTLVLKIAQKKTSFVKHLHVMSF